MLFVPNLCDKLLVRFCINIILLGAVIEKSPLLLHPKLDSRGEEKILKDKKKIAMRFLHFCLVKQ